MIPFSYTPNKSIKVYEKSQEYLEKNPNFYSEIQSLSWIYHSLHDLIPQTFTNFGSGHFFPYNESFQELQVSFSQCQFGLYKQSFTSLRSVLELGLLSVYYNINDEGHETVKKWFASEDNREANTPRNKKIWEILESHPNILDFQKSCNIKERFFNLGFLHNYVHTKGYKFSNSLGKFKSNFQTFEEDGINKWITTAKEVVTIVTVLHLLKYPIGMYEIDYHAKYGIDIPMFSKLLPHQLQKIKSFFPKNYVLKLTEIALKDEEAKLFANHNISKPDLTEEEKEADYLRHDMESIEQIGFEIWLRNELSLYKVNSIKELHTEKQSKIKFLENWAKENEFIKPNIER